MTATPATPSSCPKKKPLAPGAEREQTLDYRVLDLSAKVWRSWGEESRGRCLLYVFAVNGQLQGINSAARRVHLPFVLGDGACRLGAI